MNFALADLQQSAKFYKYPLSIAYEVRKKVFLFFLYTLLPNDYKKITITTGTKVNNKETNRRE